MKSSIFVAGASAMLAAAVPLEKRAYETNWVYEIVTVTVTAGNEPSEPTKLVYLKDPASTRHRTRTNHPTEATSEAVVVTTIVEETKPDTTEVAKPETTEETKAKPTTSAAATKPAPAGDIDLSDLKSACLDHHNVHRSNHSAPALEWDDTLASYAANTANGCVFEHDMKQGGGGYGQNLASWGTSGDMDDLKIKAAAMGITNQWYNDEMGNWGTYGQDNPPSGQSLNSYGHFTQVVWKSSTKVGCATVKCPSGTVLNGFPSWYTVCNYSPPGNFGGQYGDNVLPPLGDAMVTV